MLKSKIALLLFLLLALAGSFFFKKNLLGFYNHIGNNLEQFKKSDLGGILQEAKKEILTANPLRIGGQENSTILVRARIIAQTNFQRYDNGMLPPLIENAKLNEAALAKAKDMFALQYFEHNSPSGVDPGTLVQKYGYEYIVTGENLILGNFKDEKEVVQKWMDSPGHRANILHPRFSEIGVAIIKGTYEGRSVWIGVQEFGLPFSACASPSEALKNEIDLSKVRLDQIAIAIEAKREEVESTNRNSKRYNELIDEYNTMAKEYNDQAQKIKSLITQYNNQISVFNACVKGS